MLTITPRQIGIFQTVAEACFERELALFFRERHSATVVRLPSGRAVLGDLPESLLTKMITTGVVKAKSYGIRGQAAVAGYDHIPEAMASTVRLTCVSEACW